VSTPDLSNPLLTRVTHYCATIHEKVQCYRMTALEKSLSA